MALFRPPHGQYYEKLMEAHLHIQKAKVVKLSIDELRRLTRVLDPGELSVVILALDLGSVARVVIDETPARREAASLGINVTGTIGLLKEAMASRPGRLSLRRGMAFFPFSWLEPSMIRYAGLAPWWRTRRCSLSSSISGCQSDW
jgi:hypothetical protein